MLSTRGPCFSDGKVSGAGGCFGPQSLFFTTAALTESPSFALTGENGFLLAKLVSKMLWEAKWLRNVVKKGFQTLPCPWESPQELLDTLTLGLLTINENATDRLPGGPQMTQCTRPKLWPFLANAHTARARARLWTLGGNKSFL